MKFSLYTKANKDAYHWFYEIRTLGYKYNMNDLAASIGLVQLKKLKSMNLKRSKIIKHYMNSLKNVPNIQFLVPYEPNKYTYQIFGIRLNNRDDLIIKLKSKGIATGCHWTPMTKQPLFKRFKNNCNFIEKEINRCLTLPLHPDLKKREVDYICKNIKKYFK